MTSNKGFNGNEQVAIDAVLDAALDELGDDDSVSDESDIGDDNNGEIDADDNDDNDTTNFQDAQQEIIGETTLNNSSEDDSKSTGAVNPIVFGPEPPPRIEMPPGISPDDPEKFLARMMEEMMNGPDASGDDGAFLGNVFEQMKSQLEAEFGEVFPTNNKISTSTDTGRSTADKTTGNSISKESIKINKKKKQPSKTVNKNDVKKAIANLVEEIAKPATVVDDNDGAAIADDDDVGMAEELGMLNEILKGITSETGANNLDADSVVDGMMEQLLSKELMYEPMKQIALTFPTWLKENKESLSNDDYAE